MSPAKRRKTGGSDAPDPITPSRSVAPSSRTNAGPKPKGRVPTAAPGSKAARRMQAPPARATKAAKGDTPSAEKGEVVEPQVKLDRHGNPVVKAAFGAGALIVTFLAGQLLSMIAYGVAVANTDYDFTFPTGVGAAVGQAASQTATGVPLDIAVPPPLWLTALLQLPLWICIGAVPVWFAVKKGKGVVAELGLRMKAVDVPIGLAIGVACQLIMVPALYWLIFKVIGTKDVSAEARQLTDRATDPLSVLLVFVVVAIGAPLAEEIYFRGFAQRIFARRISPVWAIVASAAFFAASHVQPLQFPALFVFGLVLGFLAWKSGRLGPAIWAHVGFNAVTAVSLVFHIG